MTDASWREKPSTSANLTRSTMRWIVLNVRLSRVCRKAYLALVVLTQTRRPISQHVWRRKHGIPSALEYVEVSFQVLHLPAIFWRGYQGTNDTHAEPSRRFLSECLQDYVTSTVKLQKMCDQTEVLDIESYLRIRMSTSAVYPTVLLYLYQTSTLPMQLAHTETTLQTRLPGRASPWILRPSHRQRYPSSDEPHHIHVCDKFVLFETFVLTCLSCSCNDIVSVRAEIVRKISATSYAE